MLEIQRTTYLFPSFFTNHTPPPSLLFWVGDLECVGALFYLQGIKFFFFSLWVYVHKQASFLSIGFLFLLCNQSKWDFLLGKWWFSYSSFWCRGEWDIIAELDYHVSIMSSFLGFSSFYDKFFLITNLLQVAWKFSLLYACVDMNCIFKENVIHRKMLVVFLISYFRKSGWFTPISIQSIHPSVWVGVENQNSIGKVMVFHHFLKKSISHDCHSLPEMHWILIWVEKVPAIFLCWVFQMHL